jgi:hypothetical protein
VSLKAKEMKAMGIKAYEEKNNELAKYYLHLMREHQSLQLNPDTIKVWADLQMDSFKKGMISDVFKIKNMEVSQISNKVSVSRYKINTMGQLSIFGSLRMTNSLY